MLHDIALYYRVVQNVSQQVLSQLHQILTDFKKFSIGTLGNKFSIKLLLKIPPHLKRVATLPCEVLLSAFECTAAISLGSVAIF